MRTLQRISDLLGFKVAAVHVIAAGRSADSAETLIVLDTEFGRCPVKPKRDLRTQIAFRVCVVEAINRLPIRCKTAEWQQVKQFFQSLLPSQGKSELPAEHASSYRRLVECRSLDEASSKVHEFNSQLNDAELLLNEVELARECFQRNPGFVVTDNPGGLEALRRRVVRGESQFPWPPGLLRMQESLDNFEHARDVYARAPYIVIEERSKEFAVLSKFVRELRVDLQIWRAIRMRLAAEAAISVAGGERAVTQ